MLLSLALPASSVTTRTVMTRIAAVSAQQVLIVRLLALTRRPFARRVDSAQKEQNRRSHALVEPTTMSRVSMTHVAAKIARQVTIAPSSVKNRQTRRITSVMQAITALKGLNALSPPIRSLVRAAPTAITASKLQRRRKVVSMASTVHSRVPEQSPIASFANLVTIA